jgi:hypothetical protein
MIYGTTNMAALLDLKCILGGGWDQHTSNTGIILSKYNTRPFLVQGIHKLSFSINTIHNVESDVKRKFWVIM